MQFWFGWLTKGQMEVSMLDSFMGLVEILAAVFIFFFLVNAWNMTANKIRVFRKRLK